VRVETAPELDGRLDDAVWEQAEVITELFQTEPGEGIPGSERTEIRIVRTDRALYFGARMYDRDPDDLTRNQMLRDTSLRTDDRLTLIVDTFHDHRNGYMLSSNPNAARWDALIENGSFDGDWDGIWNAKARVDAQGWTLEIELPFNTVSFRPDGDTWGLNFLRGIRGQKELLRWADPVRNRSFINLSRAGVLEGMRGAQQGIGLDIVPFVTGSHFDEGLGPRNYTKAEGGFDLFYKITSGLTASLTVNSDFGETDVDSRQVNLTRFSLFFPEKREFFLQDRGIFDFGGLAVNARPFFSRRIGLDSDGEPTDIRAGAKLTGRIGPLNVGLLDAQIEGHKGVSPKNLAVGRVALNVLEESTLGIIATRGDPRSEDDNYVLGADFNYRNSRFLGNRVLTGRGWFLKSHTTGLHHEQAAFGVGLNYPNDIVNWSLAASEIQRHYDPALGFVNRSGVRSYSGSYRYRVRPETRIRTWDTSVSGALVTDTSNEIESGSVTVTALSLQSELEDTLSVSYSHTFERVVEPFEISSGITIPSSSNHWDRGSLSLAASQSRALAPALTVSYGGFFTGQRLRVAPSVTWRPSRHVLVGFEYDHNEVWLPEGGFRTQIARFRFNLFFTADISWNTFAQYDNVSDEIGIQSRLRWIVVPGREFFVVLNQGLDTSDGIRRGETRPVVKLTWLFRF
jgi:hypothetical protein